MKKTAIALALALTIVGTLASCGTTDKRPNSNSGTNSGGSASAGQVTRRYNTQMNQGRNYFYDGQYTAGSSGQVYGSDGNALSRDLTQDARDMLRDGKKDLAEMGRDIGDAARDLGSGLKDAARDIGRDVRGTASGTPSWEPDSSAQR